jgi:Uma2 family endonuclease
LAVEVISRSTAKVDRELKFAEYAEAGITEYWLVDTAKKTIEIFVLDQGHYKLLGKCGTGEVVQSKVLAGFQVAVDSLMTD